MVEYNHNKLKKISDKRVALITNIIAPYRIPCLNKVVKANQFDFEVLFYAESETNRQWKIYKDKIRFNYRILKGLHFDLGNGKTLHLNYGIVSNILRGKYNLIAIGGYDQPAAWIALVLSKIFSKKVLIFGESTLRDKRSNKFIFEKLKKIFVKSADGYIPAGRAAAEYFRYLGASEDKIIIAPFAADHDFFYSEYMRLKDFKKEIKKKKKYPEIVILFSGRFIEIKGVIYLLSAFSRLRKERSDVGLVFLGDGPEKEKYITYCEENGMSKVFFEGFRQKEELPEYYTAADIFVLPSISEPWGLVLNEAMIFGLPIISTDAAGATYDLVHEAVNGFVVKAGASDELYVALKKLCDSPQLRQEMGEQSLEIIQDYTPEKWAQGFIKAVNKVLN